MKGGGIAFPFPGVAEGPSASQVLALSEGDRVSL